MAKETAEQKLLKIIEQSQKAEAAQNPQASQQETLAGKPQPGKASKVAQDVSASINSTGLPSFSPQGLLSLVNNFDLSKITFGLREINYILMLITFVVAVFFVLELTKGTKPLEEKINLSIDAKMAKHQMSRLIPEVKEISEYLEGIAQRNIFQPFEKKVVVEEELIVSAEEPAVINTRLKDLKVVGISWLDTPESASVMVEDTVSGITYFLKAGEKIRDVTIDTIYADRVFLRYGDEQMELKL